MPTLTFPFDPGPELRVDVIVGPVGSVLRARLAAGSSLPRSVWARGQIDTAATASAVSLVLLQQLGIVSALPLVSTQGVGGQHPVSLYDVSFGITDRGSAAKPLFSPPDLQVIDINIPGVDILIGMDVLVHCKLLVDGPARTFTLEF